MKNDDSANQFNLFEYHLDITEKTYIFDIVFFALLKKMNT